jgi:hypothetical protein
MLGAVPGADAPLEINNRLAVENSPTTKIEYGWFKVNPAVAMNGPAAAALNVGRLLYAASVEL